MLASGLPRSPTRYPNKGLICSHNWLRTLEIFKRRPAVAKAAAAFTPNPNSTCKPLPSICKYWDLPSESAELTGKADPGPANLEDSNGGYSFGHTKKRYSALWPGVSYIVTAAGFRHHFQR